MRSMMQWILGTAAILVLLAGCGKGNPPPALPMPAPVPQTTPGGIGGGFISGNCGGVAGQYPLSQTPFYGSLTSQYGYSNGNSLQLSLGTQGFSTGQIMNVYGSAQMNLPDLANYFPQQQPGFQQQIPYQFCVSSQPATGGQPFPGLYSPGDSGIAITMYGIAQVPVYTYPYVPGGNQFTQQQVTVTIGAGQGCYAIINNGRVQGCVLIQIGNNGQYLYYNSY